MLWLAPLAAPPDLSPGTTYDPAIPTIRTILGYGSPPDSTRISR
jgi:hypothetical protein